jgi:hypothetical protein
MLWGALGIHTHRGVRKTGSVKGRLNCDVAVIKTTADVMEN